MKYASNTEFLPLFFLIPGRVTFVIDKEGTVRHIFNSQFKAEEHVSQAMNVLNQI